MTFTKISLYDWATRPIRLLEYNEEKSGPSPNRAKAAEAKTEVKSEKKAVEPMSTESA